ncbi:WD40 repeat-like protein [Gigaspora margarita]|uniref:WD40 repeat-like protein n=2 Tax=Gigaspora margarita TaxID=4874 RepID=A0A8H4A214_GIGMA|nr:WD40 repeat-like protein [Gigaspora margarita]
MSPMDTNGFRQLVFDGRQAALHPESQALKISRVVGGCLSSRPIIFSLDSKYFFCSCSNKIKVISVTTGEVVKTIFDSSGNCHNDEITCMMLNPNDPQQLLSGSLDGTIKVWKYSDVELLKKYEFGIPIYRMVILASYPDRFFVVTGIPCKNASCRGKQKAQALLYFRFDKKDQPEMHLLCKSKSMCTGLVTSPDGEFLIISFLRTIRIIKIKLNQQKGQKWPKYTHSSNISCIAIHPSKPYISIGDEYGKITHMYCLKESQIQDPVKSSVHWHPHKVNSLAFTSDGTYLLSGGKESVLVIWQIETGHTQFLPRLGSEIRSVTISPDQTLYAINLLDNSIKILSAINLEIKQAVQGLKHAQVDASIYPLSTGLVIEPRNHLVVLNGLPGTIQFYNPHSDRHVMEHEVSQRTMISRAFEKDIVYPNVNHVSFSSNGNWMATVDSREDGETTPELYLKFWKFDPNSQTYVLNARIDNPHSKAVVSLNFHPGTNDTSLSVVTTGLDNKFKVWKINSESHASQVFKDSVSWMCKFVGSYRQYTPRATAFSQDGSILSVAYDSIITLWDSRSNVLRDVLTLLPNYEFIRHLAFTNNSPFLVVTTQNFLYVWNLLTCTIWWSYRIEAHHLAVDSKSTRFIIASNSEKLQECRLFVFEPQTAIPVMVHTVKDIVKAIAYFPRKFDEVSSPSNAFQSYIIYLNQNYDMLMIGENFVEKVH